MHAWRCSSGILAEQAPVQGVPWLKNVLLSIVLRALDRALTNEACNVYRDAIYARLHEGTVWYWAART